MTKRPIAATGPPSPGGESKLDGLLADGLVPQGQADRSAIRTLRCRTIAQGRFHQLNYVRHLPPQPVMEEETAGLLGEDIAPNASEALLAAFGSCLAIGIHANAVARRIPIRSLELELEAEIDTTAAYGTGDIDPKPIGFETIRVSVHVQAEATDEVLEAVIQHATLWSPVANTLYNPVHLDVALGRKAPLPTDGSKVA